MPSALWSRRDCLAAALSIGVAPGALAAPTAMTTTSPLTLIEAPSSLGLRPPRPGHEPGTWKAPAALQSAGLSRQLKAERVVSLPHPRYAFDAEPGTTVRNGHAMRAYSEALADEVQHALAAGRFPLVIGGDCSVLLGALLGMRRRGHGGLIHVDGHADFFHPGNYSTSVPGSAAGMDLALATGRGDPLLTNWGAGMAPLVADADVVQVGERDTDDPAYAFKDYLATAIHRMSIERCLALGPAAAAQQALALVKPGRLWLHVDVDVLDQAVMPAVDSPGTPGFDFGQLGTLVRGLLASGRVVGADVTIFDPELDTDGAIAQRLAACLAESFGRG